MGHLGAQPHCKALTSQEVGRCYPGADMARRSLLLLPTTCTHLYSPSGLKVPGVPRGQRDPREKCQGQGIRVRVIHLGSEININKAWLISGDQHLSNPHEPVLSLTGAPGGPGSPWPPCWREKESDKGEPDPPHQKNCSTAHCGGWAQDGSIRSEDSGVLTAGPGAPLGPCRP